MMREGQTRMNTVSDISAFHPHPGPLPGRERGEEQQPFAALFQQAVKGVEKVASQFVSTALVFPLLEQVSDSPFKTEMFDGGFTEKAFRQRLNMYMADNITSGNLGVSQSITNRLTEWLKNQPPAKWQQVAAFKGIDLNG